jgi:hypothetical protein
VVQRDVHPVPVGAYLRQQHPQQRRHRQIEPPRPLPRRDLVCRRDRGVTVQIRQVLLAPRERHLPGDDLYRLLDPGHLAEARAQAGVPGQQRVPRRVQRGDVQRSLQVEGELFGVDVVGVLAVCRVEEEALLQRRQRPDVLNPHLRHRALRSSASSVSRASIWL